ncbi:alpha/beta-hydrolase [Trematosphaeria pertusa]|uniref:Alpha/beta-hydrolase n=1 Tax=Trematosphaeria pertusa TaxID=390896 RepID=A0A6A6I1Q5_9PLEO|nr:alpha/beta-hydrolase [Trematosphaeria pertusa]KAF2243510.1 alpha/beta-hydrolase [Trematosphaeria pertusa]
MAPILSHQPLKALATLLLVASAPPYLAVLSLFYAAKRCRPVPGWSLKTAIGNEWLRLFYLYATKVHLRPFSASASKLKERYVLAPPGPADLYTGILREAGGIKPCAMPAIWFPGPPPTDTTERKTCKVVMHLQGGAFVTATDPAETGKLPAKIFESKLGAKTFYAQYRLARTEASRFPAAVQDAVSFYRYVLDQGVEARNVVLSGDSAGANIVVGLLRYIEDSRVLPVPRGAMLWSPWVDVSDAVLSRYGQSKSLRVDFLGLGLLRWGKDAYEPASASEESERYLRPVEHAFRSKTPVFVNAGTAELLYDEVGVFVERMQAVEGNQVCFVETKDAPHDVLVAGTFTGFVEEAEEAAGKAREFFDRCG